MQNRRIINQLFAQHGVTPLIRIESNSIIALMVNVVLGRCMAVLPKDVAEFLSGGKELSLVQIADTGLRQAVGLILQHREPRTPILAALLTEARNLS